MCSGRSTHSISRRKPGRCLFLVALLAVLVQTEPARPAHSGLGILAPVPVVLDASPGTTTTVSFLVSNRDGYEMEVEEDVALPPGWTLVIGASSFPLAPGEERLRLVTFHIPLSSPPSTYTVDYSVTDIGEGGASCGEAVSVTVVPQGEIQILEKHAAERTLAGNPLTSRLTVVNRSNFPMSVSLELASSNSYPVFPDSLNLTLASGEARDVDVVVETPKEASARVSHIVRVSAEATGHDGRTSDASLSLTQTVLPRVSGGPDPYRRLPATLRTLCVGGGESSAIQTELVARGGLDASESHKFELAVRTPGDRDVSIFALREEYSLRIHGRDYDLRLGDGLYKLSRLMGHRMRGRGGSLEFDVDRWQLQCSYFEPATGELERQVGSVGVGYDVDPKLSVGVRLLGHGGASRGAVGAELSFNPTEQTSVDLEAAAHSVDAGQRAYWVRARRVGPGARYFVERVHAGAGFDGRFSDENHATASLDLPVLDRVDLTAFYRDYERKAVPEPDDDIEIVVSSIMRENARSAGVRVSVSSRLRARLDYRDVERRGEAGSDEFRYRTRTAKAAVDYLGGRFSAVTAVEFGRLDDVEASSRDVTTYSISVTAWPTSEWRLSGHRRSALVGSPDPSNSGGTAALGTEFRFSDDVSVSGTARWLGLSGSPDSPPDEVMVGAECGLPFGHLISGELRWRRQEADATHETHFRLSYEMPFQVPAGRRPDVGTLRGRVLSSCTSGFEEVPDAVLMLGDLSAVSDENGEYVFPGVAPGEYPLAVASSSIGLERVPLSPLPRTVVIEGGKALDLDLAVARAGRIEGIVRSADPPATLLEPAALVEAARVPALVVEATDGSRSLRSLTDAAGRFRFERLSPGRWTVRIKHDCLPRFCELDHETFVVDVAPGETRTVEAVIRSTTESIPIIETGEVKLLTSLD